MRLVLDVPSVDTVRDYEIGKTIKITQGRSPGSYWSAEVVGVGDEAETGTLGHLGSIKSQGVREYVRRVVIELRSGSRDKLERVRLGVRGISVRDNDYGVAIRSNVIQAFDIKKIND